MVHPLTHKEALTYVLNTTIAKLPENPQLDQEQQEELQGIEKAVEECVKIIFKQLSSSTQCSLKPSDYPALFGLLGNEGYILVETELKEMGIELEKSSSKIVRNIHNFKEHILIPKKKLSSKEEKSNS